MSARAALLAAALAAALFPATAARGGQGDAGVSLIWVSGKQVVRQVVGRGEATALATLPVDPARIRRIEAAGDGSAILLDLGGPAAWLDLAAGPARLVWLPCRGLARLQPGGGTVACSVQGGIARLRLRPGGPGEVVAGGGPEPAAFADATGDSVVARAGDTLVRRRPGAVDAPLAVAPVANLSIAPDGGRAVGSFATQAGGGALFTFRLDGKAARRKLIPGVPVAWSANSAWLLVETDVAACAIRAVGGEYKCWDGFHGRALDATGHRALLARDHPGGGVDLFVASVDGAVTRPPTAIAVTVPGAGPAALLAPAGAAVEPTPAAPDDDDDEPSEPE